MVHTVHQMTTYRYLLCTRHVMDVLYTTLYCTEIQFCTHTVQYVGEERKCLAHTDWWWCGSIRCTILFVACIVYVLGLYMSSGVLGVIYRCWRVDSRQSAHVEAISCRTRACLRTFDFFLSPRTRACSRFLNYVAARRLNRHFFWITGNGNGMFDVLCVRVKNT